MAETGPSQSRFTSPELLTLVAIGLYSGSGITFTKLIEVAVLIAVLVDTTIQENTPLRSLRCQPK